MLDYATADCNLADVIASVVELNVCDFKRAVRVKQTVGNYVAGMSAISNQLVVLVQPPNGSVTFWKKCFSLTTSHEILFELKLLLLIILNALSEQLPSFKSGA